MWHKNSKTTELNTHVSNRELSKLKNSLDTLQIRGYEYRMIRSYGSDITCYMKF